VGCAVSLVSTNSRVFPFVFTAFGAVFVFRSGQFIVMLSPIIQILTANCDGPSKAFNKPCTGLCLRSVEQFADMLDVISRIKCVA
jgi:hypothetical protein